MTFLIRMRSRYPFPHSLQIVIWLLPTFLLEMKCSSCKKISWSPVHCLYSIQNDALTITNILGQGGLWRFFLEFWHHILESFKNQSPCHQKRRALSFKLVAICIIFQRTVQVVMLLQEYIILNRQLWILYNLIPWKKQTMTSFYH